MNMVDFALSAILYATVFLPRWKSQRLVQRTMLYCYIVVILAITLMPIASSLPGIFSHAYSPMNLIPFIDIIYERGDFIRQVRLNVLLFVPFGFLYPSTTERNTLSNTLLHAFLLSLIIELAQPLLSPWRVSDITDIITNTSGACIGYLLYYPVFWFLRKRKG